MRFLADAGISPKTVKLLKQLGHEATHVRTLGLQRAPDTQVIQRARSDGSIVLMFDLPGRSPPPVAREEGVHDGIQGHECPQ